MPKLIYTFSDGAILFYDAGRFDEWCVYLQPLNKKRMAPKDVQYFQRLCQLASQYGTERLMTDFLAIYCRTTTLISATVLKLIHALSFDYGDEALSVEKVFTILYAGMVAEENKQNAILKKRIKRLGVHQVLVENMSPVQAAQFSKGKNWAELDAQCRQRGF